LCDSLTLRRLRGLQPIIGGEELCYSTCALAHARRTRLSNLKQLIFTFGSHASRCALTLSVTLLAHDSGGSDQLGVSDFLEQIDRIEASSSAFNPQLAEVYLGLGKSLIDEGNFPDAQNALRRSVQIERINYGLDSLSQTPHLLLLADLDYVLGNSKAAQKALQNVYSVSTKHYGSKDARMLPVLDQLLTWQTDRYQDTSAKGNFDHVVAAEVIALRIAKVVDSSILMKDPQAPYYFRKLAAVQYLIANHIKRHGLPTDTGFEFTTGNSVKPAGPSSATHTYFRRGKAALLNRVDSIIQQSNTDILKQASAIAELADWYLIFGQKQQAASAYQVAFDTLKSGEVSDQVRNDFFALPKKIDFPFVESNGTVNQDTLEVSLWITETGRTRDIEIINPPDTLTDGETKTVRSALLKTRFRPRLIEGSPEAIAHTVSFPLPRRDEAENS
jgi:tetratricopeptide (TPR) repeat protein